ncbi:unnamed protein product [Adineta steineri]|uniref:monoamine oxidase n=2 Tax=Adineta steineri TaxID=433720 RepID=A0A814B9W4_9BILA|nr:unnamed protein product [Adineta steineri]
MDYVNSLLSLILRANTTSALNKLEEHRQRQSTITFQSILLLLTKEFNSPTWTENIDKGNQVIKYSTNISKRYKLKTADKTDVDHCVLIILHYIVSVIHKYKITDSDSIWTEILDNPLTKTSSVILALPPKLLISTVQLTPMLPSSLIEQLKKCVTWMASTCKAVLVYERAWWREKKLSGFAVSRQLKAQEWHDASSATCNALFVFCLANTTKQQVIDATIKIFGSDAENPTAVYITDWSNEAFTSSSINDGRGGHPHVTDVCRQAYWNGRLWLSSSEVSDTDSGFLEGAVTRGIQVADQLAELMFKEKTKS